MRNTFLVLVLVVLSQGLMACGTEEEKAGQQDQGEVGTLAQLPAIDPAYQEAVQSMMKAKVPVDFKGPEIAEDAGQRFLTYRIHENDGADDVRVIFVDEGGDSTTDAVHFYVQINAPSAEEIRKEVRNQLISFGVVASKFAGEIELPAGSVDDPIMALLENMMKSNEVTEELQWNGKKLVIKKNLTEESLVMVMEVEQ